MTTAENKKNTPRKAHNATNHAEPSIEEKLREPLEQVKRPSMYQVLLLNDDFTPMEFVVSILQKCFGKTAEEAHAIMLKVHHQGSAVCGIYTYEVAETKIAQVMELARLAQHPLQCTIERA